MIGRFRVRLFRWVVGSVVGVSCVVGAGAGVGVGVGVGDGVGVGAGANSIWRISAQFR